MTFVDCARTLAEVATTFCDGITHNRNSNTRKTASTETTKEIGRIKNNMDSGTTATGEKKEEAKQTTPAEQYKSYLQQGVDEQRYMVPTKNGIIDEVIV